MRLMHIIALFFFVNFTVNFFLACLQLSEASVAATAIFFSLLNGSLCMYVCSMCLFAFFMKYLVVSKFWFAFAPAVFLILPVVNYPGLWFGILC